MRFYTASKLGSKRARTPEGYLVCLDVPIARTGEMLYAPGEIPGLIPGKDGLIRVRREPEDVFDPTSIGSFVAKPTTNDHPSEMVTAENWRRYAMGSGQNIRQGTGAQSDLLLADLIWTDPATIKDIENGKDEISNGYDADYEMISPGIYRQLDITGNHIALVDEGRCGTRCAIGDSAAALQTTPAAEAALATNEAPSCGCGGGHLHHDASPVSIKRRKSRDMAAKKIKGTMLDRLRRAFTTKDEAGFEEAMSAVEEAAEATQEEQEQAEITKMIGEAIATGIAPLVQRLDAVEVATADLRTKDRRSKDDAPANMGAERAPPEEALAGLNAGGGSAEHNIPDFGDDGVSTLTGDPTLTGDNAPLVAFLKSKGMSDEDIATAVAAVAVPTSDDAATEGTEGSVGTQSGQAAGDPEDGDSGVHFPSLTAGGGDPSAGVQGSAGTQSGDAKMTADSAGLAVIFRDTVARAEMLAPGVKLPTYDGKKPRKAMADTICALRRDALKRAFASDDRKGFVAVFDANPDFAKLSCGAVKLMFSGASELAKAANNTSARTNDAATARDAMRGHVATFQSAADDLWKHAR